MRYLITMIVSIAFVGLSHGQPALESPDEYADTNPEPIPTVEVEGELLHPTMPSINMMQQSFEEVSLADFEHDLISGSAFSLNLHDQGYDGVSNVQEFLHGRIPGMNIIKRETNQYDFQIRGQNGILINDEPLLVVDGTVMGTTKNLNAINPYSIKNITVLKGPQAAIYGSRGANGVVVIETY